jgi:hypothetical protein
MHDLGSLVKSQIKYHSRVGCSLFVEGRQVAVEENVLSISLLELNGSGPDALAPHFSALSVIVHRSYYRSLLVPTFDGPFSLFWAETSRRGGRKV